MVLTIVLWVLRIIAGIILVQTLFFKFKGASESKYIFSKVGMEPWGRYASGITELIAVLLLFTPWLTLYGAVLGLLVIIPAIILHLTKLGIQVQGDKGMLFYMALIVFVTLAALVVLLL